MSILDKLTSIQTYSSSIPVTNGKLFGTDIIIENNIVYDHIVNKINNKSGIKLLISICRIRTFLILYNDYALYSVSDYSNQSYGTIIKCDHKIKNIIAAIDPIFIGLDDDVYIHIYNSNNRGSNKFIAKSSFQVKIAMFPNVDANYSEIPIITNDNQYMTSTENRFSKHDNININHQDIYMIKILGYTILIIKTDGSLQCIKNLCKPQIDDFKLDKNIQITSLVDVLATRTSWHILLDDGSIIKISTNTFEISYASYFDESYDKQPHCINRCTINTFKFLPKYFKNNIYIFVMSLKYGVNIKLPKFMILFIADFLC